MSGRNILAIIEQVSNWRLLYQHKQTLIDKNTDWENSTWSNNCSRVGNQVLIMNNQGGDIKPHVRKHTPTKKFGPMGW